LKREGLSRIDWSTPGLAESIGGAILSRNHSSAEERRNPFVRALIGGGYHSWYQGGQQAKDLAGHPGEKVTEGLDGCAIAQE